MRLFFILISIFCCSTSIIANEADSILVDSKIIKVGIKKAPPFVIIEDEVSGLSVELWELIAQELNINYEYVQYENITDIIEALEKRELSIAISPLTVTGKRMRKIGFTQPFFITNLTMATKIESSTWFETLKKFFSAGFLKLILMLFLVIFVFGFILWLVEKKHNAGEFRRGLIGVFDGIWWSAVTMTTVGYGDKSPKTIFGRFLAIIWMFTAVIIISGFTAGISSSLTVNSLSSKISGLSDLYHSRVATIKGSSSDSFLQKRKIKRLYSEDLISGLQAIQNDSVDVFIYDEPILEYYILKSDKLEYVQILPFKFNTQYYSFGLPKNNDIQNKIDPVLIDILESNYWKEILDKYNIQTW